MKEELEIWKQRKNKFVKVALNSGHKLWGTVNFVSDGGRIFLKNNHNEDCGDFLISDILNCQVEDVKR